MTLQEYFDSKDYGAQTLMAADIGVTKSHLSEIARKKKQPSLRVAKKIYEHTGGLVGYESYFEDEETDR